MPRVRFVAVAARSTGRATSSRVSPVGRARARRGFTLVELSVAAGLGVLLLILALSLVAALLSAHATNTATGAAQRDLSYVTTQMSADFDAARVCDPAGMGVPLRDIDASQVQLWADVTGDGKLDVVGWRWSSSQLQRAVVAGDGTCTFSLGTLSWRTLADGVGDPDSDPAPGPLFAGRRLNAAVSGYPSGDCVGAGADSCLFDAVEVSFSLRGAGSERWFPSSQIFALNVVGSRLLR